MISKSFLAENNSLVRKIVDLLEENMLSPLEAEHLLAWIIGLSVGVRGGNIQDMHPIMETFSFALIMSRVGKKKEN